MTTQPRAPLRFAEDITVDVRDQVADLLTLWSSEVGEGNLVISRLAGGASNVNLKVDSGSLSWVLRLCMPDSARWGVNRAAAIQAQRDAASIGLAPAVVATKLPEGHYLSEFVVSDVLTPELLRRDGLIPQVARTLKALHKGETTSRDFSPFDDMRTFLELGAAENARQPDNLDVNLARAMRVEALFRTRPVPRAFCHSDLVPQNFLRVGDVFNLVDWDYAGRGWIAFEMASFACQAQLSAEETEVLLCAYDPDVDDSGRARVELMRFVAGVREAVWAVMAEPILGSQTLPLDGWTYHGYAASNLAQAEKVIEAGFDEYLQAARQVRPGAAF